MGEIFHGLNFQEIQFSLMIAPQNFELHKNFCCQKIYTCAKTVTQYQKALSVRGYHVYEDIWEVAVGETVECVLEPGNFHDKNAIAVEKDGRIIGYLPRKVSHISALFLNTGGTVRCTVTGRR